MRTPKFTVPVVACPAATPGSQRQEVPERNAAVSTASPAAAPAAAAGMLASAEGELAGVRIDVTQFTRDSGGAVTLRRQMTSASTSSVKMGENCLGDASIRSDSSAGGGIHLLVAQ